MFDMVFGGISIIFFIGFLITVSLAIYATYIAATEDESKNTTQTNNRKGDNHDT